MKALLLLVHAQIQAQAKTQKSVTIKTARTNQFLPLQTGIAI